MHVNVLMCRVEQIDNLIQLLRAPSFESLVCVFIFPLSAFSVRRYGSPFYFLNVHLKWCGHYFTQCNSVPDHGAFAPGAPHTTPPLVCLTNGGDGVVLSVPRLESDTGGHCLDSAVGLYKDQD